MQEQLKPCPFCGGNPEKTKNKIYHSYAGKPLYVWEIRCLLCGASIGAPENAEAYAIDLWNGAIPRKEKCEILEKEAAWLADELAILSEITTDPDDWRKAARKAVEDKQ